MRRRLFRGWGILPLLVFIGVPVLSVGRADNALAIAPINFTRGTLAGAGFTTSTPGSLAFGPDGKLYVADTSGRIQALTLNPTTKAVTGVQQITSATDLQEVYGIAFDPLDGSMWVTNTISGFGDMGQAPPSGSPGSYPGKITKFPVPYSNGTKVDVITGLPASNSGHEANGLAFGPTGCTGASCKLFIAQGSTTNAGVISAGSGLFQREEAPTSGAILVADVHAPAFNGTITYSPADVYSTTVQKTGGDVSVYAPGLRNPYDIIFHTNGVFYNTDNGPNNGYGPGSATCNTTFANDANAADELNIIVQGNYYGHPNRNRGFAGDARQCKYHAGTEPSDAEYTAPIGLLGPSTDGLVEYRSNVFGGQMNGDLLTVGWVDNDLRRIRLGGGGQSVTSNTQLASGFANPLDVTMDPADGTIYVAEWGGNKITFLKPDTTAQSSITVSGIFPAGGPIAGGQAVTITGTNFTVGDTTATIDGLPLTNVVLENSTTLKGITPPHPATGAKDVVVTSGSLGSATLTGGYFYSAGGGISAPIADAGPDWSGPIAHETHAHVTLDGRNSYDPDPGGFIASYSWTENNVVLTTNPVDSIQFVQGEHFVTLTVTDGDGQTDTDIVRINVTAVAENPQPFYCADVQGDGAVNSGDLTMVAQRFNKKWVTVADRWGGGYARLADVNTDGTINAIDLMRVATDFTGSCDQLGRDIRSAALGTEAFMDINNALAPNVCVYRSQSLFGDVNKPGIDILKVVRNVSSGSCTNIAVTNATDTQCPASAVGGCVREWYNAGFSQTTPYIPGQGRHMGSCGGIACNDTTFEPERPESLLYEPGNSSQYPGGWRLGGLMYVIPVTLEPLPPDGFPTNEDPWHYHNGLCLWGWNGSGYTGVAQDTTQDWCLAHTGSPVWIEKAGWLLHLWAFVPNPAGRFVEVNNNF